MIFNSEKSFTLLLLGLFTCERLLNDLAHTNSDISGMKKCSVLIKHVWLVNYTVKHHENWQLDSV
jgi:hypothetical protein